MNIFAAISIALILGAVCYAYYVHRKMRHLELAERTTAWSFAAMDKLDILLKEKGPDHPETQDALRALIKAQIDCREVMPHIDLETHIASLIKLVHKK